MSLFLFLVGWEPATHAPLLKSILLKPIFQAVERAKFACYRIVDDIWGCHSPWFKHRETTVGLTASVCDFGLIGSC